MGRRRAGVSTADLDAIATAHPVAGAIRRSRAITATGHHLLLVNTVVHAIPARQVLPRAT